jgi:hypothetical protein
MAQFLVTTTGTQSQVVLNDLGGRTLIHPTVNLDLLLEYSTDELSASNDLQSALSNAFISVTDGNSNPITDSQQSTSVPLSTDDLVEGQSNLYFTNARVAAHTKVANAVQVGSNISQLANDAGYLTSVVQSTFGSQFQEFSSTSSVSYNSTSLFKAYSFTTQSNPAGKYRVALDLHYTPGSTSKVDTFQLKINESQIGLSFIDESNDTGTDIRKIVNLKGYFVLNSTNTFNVELWSCVEHSSVTTTIKAVNVEVWRVS